MSNILIIEGDRHIGNMLEEILALEGYSVKRALSTDEAVVMIDFISLDLILLDFMIDSGTTESILYHTRGIPVIVLSAKSDACRITGSRVDFMTRPFDIRELLSRIAVHLRLQGKCAYETLITAWGLSLDVFTHDFAVGNEPVHLTGTEYIILELLMLNCGKIVKRSSILERTGKNGCTETSLKQHISNLRRKIRKAGGKEEIESVYGIGFRLTGG